MIFKEISSATNALRAMQGFPFYDKPMVSLIHLQLVYYDFLITGFIVNIYRVSVTV